MACDGMSSDVRVMFDSIHAPKRCVHTTKSRRAGDAVFFSKERLTQHKWNRYVRN